MGLAPGYQEQDYTAIAVVERLPRQRHDPPGKADESPPESDYRRCYLHRPPLGTPYPVIVKQVLAVLDTPPLSRSVPLVVDMTGLGAPVIDRVREAGTQPHAVTIIGGIVVSQEDPFSSDVPKRDLVRVLITLVREKRLKIPPPQRMPLAEPLLAALTPFSFSYEAGRESEHDDLVLAVVLACWWGERNQGGAAGYSWTVR